MGSSQVVPQANNVFAGYEWAGSGCAFSPDLRGVVPL
jgi:hypothetical protein